jgi:membrane protein insertase Oxa1/YidC/SpoIIIJ
MTKAAWLLVLTLFLVSAFGIVPASFGMFFTPLAIILAMFLLAVAERKRLAARLNPGEKAKMPKMQKIFLAIFVVLALALVFIGGLTTQ